MAFELDPIFHNQTMVKILLAQGHLLHAGKICQGLLNANPHDENLKDLYEKTRTTFQKNFAGSAIRNPIVEEGFDQEDEVTEPGLRKERLEADAKNLNQAKVLKLEGLLQKVQERRL